jgi:hypothetical protein
MKPRVDERWQWKRRFRTDQLGTRSLAPLGEGRHRNRYGERSADEIGQNRCLEHFS